MLLNVVGVVGGGGGGGGGVYPLPVKALSHNIMTGKGGKMQLQPVVILKGRATDPCLNQRWDTYFHNEGHLCVSRAQEGLSIGPFIRRRGGN